MFVAYHKNNAHPPITATYIRDNIDEVKAALDENGVCVCVYSSYLFVFLYDFDVGDDTEIETRQENGCALHELLEQCTGCCRRSCSQE